VVTHVNKIKGKTQIQVDDVKSDVANMRITDWKDCIRNRPKWKEFAEKAKASLQL
jgi:hypothetical protein